MRFYESFSQTGGGGSARFHTLIQKHHKHPKPPKNGRTNLNKDFTNTGRGEGVTILWKFFIKFRFFLKDGFPYRVNPSDIQRSLLKPSDFTNLNKELSSDYLDKWKSLGELKQQSFKTKRFKPYRSFAVWKWHWMSYKDRKNQELGKQNVRCRRCISQLWRQASW